MGRIRLSLATPLLFPHQVEARRARQGRALPLEYRPPPPEVAEEKGLRPLMQTPGEVVWKAVRFQSPDRLPRDLWILPAAEKAHGHALQDFLIQYPIDFARVGFHPPIEDGRYTPGRWTDEWGSTWVNTREGMLGMVDRFPVDDWKALRHWKPPFDLIDKGFERAGLELREAGPLFKQGGDLTLFHRMCWLRPPEKIYLDLLEEPPELRTFFDGIVEWNTRRLEEWLRFDYEGIMVMDDWGTQRALMIDPAIWRAWFKPVYAQWFRRVKETGRLVFFHSDGMILPIIEDLIEIGCDALNCQVHVIGEEILAERFAGRLCFWGELDRQQLLPHGTPEEVRAAAGAMIRLFATPRGGYISQFELGSDVPAANLRAAVEAFISWEPKGS